MIAYETSQWRFSIIDKNKRVLNKNLKFELSNEKELNNWLRYASDKNYLEFLIERYNEKYFKEEPLEIKQELPYKVVVNNIMQKNYSYFREKEIWDFSDHPEFTPDLTPYQMISFWVFWWKYFWDIPWTNEYPKDFEDLVRRKSVWVWNRKDYWLNFFTVDASQSLQVWIESWWINKIDPRWWFEWYCRFYFWRRSDDDKRQISRWHNMQRHLTQVVKNCRKWNHNCRTRQRQALLHWSYDTVNKY